MEEMQPFFQSTLDSSILEFDQRLNSDVARQLASHNLKVSVVETLTQGYLSHRLARLAGQNFDCGLICATPQSAIRLCGVQAGTLRHQGFSSMETTKELAAGFQKRSHSNLCVALNGQWSLDTKSGESHRGIVHMVFIKGSQEKTKTFPLEGHVSSFPDHAAQSVLLTLKNWLQFMT